MELRADHVVARDNGGHRLGVIGGGDFYGDMRDAEKKKAAGFTAYKIKVDNGPETVLTRGQTFYEAPGQLHAVSSNASNTEPAKVLVVVVNEIGKPLTVPEKP